jgi:hypothetical protein
VNVLGNFRQECGENFGKILTQQENHQKTLDEHDASIKAHDVQLIAAAATVKTYGKIASGIAAGLAGAETWFHKIGPWLSGRGGH